MEGKGKKMKEMKKFYLYTGLLLHNYGLELIEYPVAFCTVYANDDQNEFSSIFLY